MLKLPAGITHNKFLLYGGVIAVGAGLYVLYQRKKSGTSASTPAGTTTASTELDSLSSQFSDLIGGLSTENSQISDNLSKLIATSDQNFVSALNNQTKSLSDQLSGLNSGSGTADLENAIAAQTTTLTDAIKANSGTGSITQAITAAQGNITQQASLIQQDLKSAIQSSGTDVKGSLGSAITGGVATVNAESNRLEKVLEAFFSNAFAGVTTSIAELKSMSTQEASQVAQSLQSLNSLTATIESNRDDAYLSYGLQSGAACYVQNLSDFDFGCLQAHTLIDWPGGGSHATTSAALKSTYSSCFKGDHYDMVCVGKIIKGKFGQ